jgi:hypothetical protein
MEKDGEWSKLEWSKTSESLPMSPSRLGFGQTVLRNCENSLRGGNGSFLVQLLTSTKFWEEVKAGVESGLLGAISAKVSTCTNFLGCVQYFVKTYL